MATQNLSYARTNGSTSDTGEGDVNAIRPYTDGEDVLEAVLNRPLENLQGRTETVRRAIEDLKYLTDADRALLLSGGGLVTWPGADTGDGTKGTFTLGAPLLLRPFLAPETSTRASATLSGVTFQTRLSGSVVPRAYSGANKISVTLNPLDGASFNVTLTGTPADNVQVTFDKTSVTRENLRDLLNAHATFTGLGLEVVVSTGLGTVVGSEVTSVTTVQLTGAVDAERHLISPAGLVSFFATSSNRLKEGDTLCIFYDDLVMESNGGRRQSIAQAPENKANVDGNLFVLRNFPQRLAHALPLCTVQADKLIFVNNVVVTPDVPATLELSSNKTASNVLYVEGPSWYDNTPNPLSTVQDQINKIIVDLRSETGSDKIGYAGGSTWASGEGSPAASVGEQLDKIVNDLAAAAGASRIGATPNNTGTYTLPGNDVQEQLGNLQDNVNSLRGYVDTQDTSLNGRLTTAEGNITTGATSLSNHLGDTDSAHAASAISYAGAGTWADASAGPAAGTVEGALDNVVSTLAANTGAAKIGAGNRYDSATPDPEFLIDAHTVETQLSDLYGRVYSNLQDYYTFINTIAPATYALLGHNHNSAYLPLTSPTVSKAWARIQSSGTGTASVLKGHNVDATVQLLNGGLTLRVSFTTPMPDINFCPVATAESLEIRAIQAGTGAVDLSGVNVLGNSANFSGTLYNLYLVVFG